MLQKQAYQPMDAEKEAQFLERIHRLSGLVTLWKLSCNKDPQAAQVAFDGMHTI